MKTITAYIKGTNKHIELENRYQLGDIFHYKKKQYKVIWLMSVTMWIRELDDSEYIYL